MKEIFGLIVGAFKNFDKKSSRSFQKRVLILETVAKVLSSVLMLDLDCNDLILEMFQHFLKTIRPKHSDIIFSLMETIMTLVLEETKSVFAQLLSCPLNGVKVVEKNNLHTVTKLAEKVLVNCSVKLKSYLAKLFNGNSALLRDYSKIVVVVFQGKPDTSIQNEMNASGENQEADHKLS
ncbi:hypothetical protein IEQ34_026900 [Dendrobium chrysotoxum]|uniref:Uncharacterized protein n=1 Tax=Dendrobium chrysotoxum TaxID=161865 RepID=A0AAV7FKQ4_DENCH|nr:hypothetical protein IEQ34_026900 [Dendrobium chrysotoxum]